MDRKGAACVEFAIVISLVFVPILIGMIEVGRAIQVQQVITNASREGARVAVLPGTTEGYIRSTVDNYLTAAKVPTSAATVTRTQDGDAITVNVELPYAAVSWLPPKFLA